MALMVARAVPEKTGPTSSTMAVPHGPAGVGAARRRMRRELGERAVPEPVVDDAVLILSELLSNSCRYARPLGNLSELVGRTTADMVDAVLVRAVTASRQSGADAAEECDPGGILVRWWTHADGIVVEVTDGGAPTRPRPASPSLTARGGRGLSIVGKLADAWGVRDAPGEVTVWAALPVRPERRDDPAA
ncbi:ATP-binding protein [Streptomyces sp. NRRL B-24484]|uniref:ATP-binding protein n=1 Tax=Streptomyces sp. NRRL B-24484 TaxID=1463833 RepID=UPI0007C4E81A